MTAQDQRNVFKAAGQLVPCLITVVVVDQAVLLCVGVIAFVQARVVAVHVPMGHNDRRLVEVRVEH